jgi:PPOX class probable F420-dependent enzyme
MSPIALSASTLEFVRERHLATLTTMRADGSPHVVAIGFTWDDEYGLVRMITFDGSQKVRNVEHAAGSGTGRPRAAVCQVAGGAWLTLEGPVRVERDAAEVAEAVRRYAERYRQPQVNPQRVALVIEVDRVLGRA